MALCTKPNFDDTKERWRAFWNHEVLDRPICLITGPKPGVTPPSQPAYMAEAVEDPISVAERVCAASEARFWLGEAIPERDPSFGPDQYAAFLGGRLKRAPEGIGTSWSVPVIESWQDTPPLRLDPANETWRKMLEVAASHARVGEGRFLVSVIDLHSNMDALSGLRGPQQLMLDLHDCPEMIDKAMADVRATYQLVYDGLFRASKMDERGSVAMGMYCDGKHAIVQSDVICMLSPGQFRRWVLPALEEETSFLDHSVMHYDGPGALVHLDDVLALPELDIIQWVPGDGAAPLPEWMDLYTRIQRAGKAVVLWGSIDEIKHFHRELRPELVIYNTYARSEQEAADLLAWLKQHT
jgi:hypothetical protein